MAPEVVGSSPIAVPEDTPLAQAPAAQCIAFKVLVESLVPPGTPLAKAFSGQLRLLPHAFLAAHLVGLESSASEVRSLFLRNLEAAVSAICVKKGDGDALLRAIDLGLTREAGPARPYAAEVLEAVQDVIRLGSGADAAARLGRLLDASPAALFRLFHAAQLLRAKDALRLLRLAATRAGALEAGLLEMGEDMLPHHAKVLSSALRGGLDSAAPAQVIHVAAGLGNCSVVSRAVSMGQAVNSTCRLRGETSAMLAAAGGHVEVLRWLLRAKADLSLRARDGSTALRCAQRCGQKEVVRLLEDPLSRLA